MALADFGLGVRASLDDLVKQRIEQEELARRAQMEQARLDLQNRQLSQQGEQFTQRMGLDRDKFGFEQEQYQAEAPMREANLGFLRTRTRDLEQQPLYAEQERQAREAAAQAEHGFRMAEIGEQGRQGRLTLGAREAAKQPPAGPSPYAAERATRVLQSVKDLKDEVSNATAGFGSLLANIPATSARNFSAKLKTLASNIAFNELQEMRAASKTGGALGAVSERELALLESSLGALDQGQSPEQLRQELDKIEQSLQRWYAAQGGAAGPQPVQIAPGGGSAPADPLGIRGGT